VLFGVTAAVASCVTVNVNFPESAVQQATDDYVRDLYRAKSKGGKIEDPSAPPTSTKPSASFEFITSVYADASSFKVRTPKSMGIQEKLAGRLDEVLQWKRQGMLGESKEGLLVVRNGDKLKPIQAKKLEALAVAENEDRSGLYAEVADTNGLAGDRASGVRANFARSFQAESPSGTWLQSADGTWTQKP